MIITAPSKRARSNNHNTQHHPQQHDEQHRHYYRSSTLLYMVRNVDLPEAIVFYGIESIMEPPSAANNKDGSIQHQLIRPGVKRLLEECNEVGTASLLLNEDSNDDNDNNRLVSLFQEDYSKNNIHVRCLSHNFFSTDDNDDDESLLLYYNLQTNGRSPSPAFLLDSLNSVQIYPRGFGGHSGFGRGQWIEPRRCPLPSRTVVFIAGDWSSSTPNREGGEEEEEETEQELSINNKRNTLSRDRCSAARAAGCRIIYLEQLQQPLLLDDPTTNSNQQNQLVMIHDDESTMSLCDAVIDTFGNDNIRDKQQPISLDAISTPGNYWLNPPTSRDEFGNSVSVDDLVTKYHLERLLVHHNRASSCKSSLQEEEEEASENVNVGIMSEEEIDYILADLDGL
jgi:hypothetical protein